MIQLTDTLFVGSSRDEKHADLAATGITNTLNVAQDLEGTRGWSRGVESMQVGLIDGPGNTMAAYHAAVLALAALQKRGKTLIYCHTGGRSLAVAMMYINLTGRIGWDTLLDLFREREIDLPALHEAHAIAFSKINFGLLEKLQ